MTTDNQETEQSKPLFPLGQCYMTPGIVDLIEKYQLPLQSYLQRHQSGDWGDFEPADIEENIISLKENFRLLSAYHFSPANDPDAKIKIWIITEANRPNGHTTALLPSEY